MTFIKSILWFLVSPIRRRAWLRSPRLREFAKCIHTSTRVQSADAISWHASTKIGRNTQIDIVQSNAAINLAKNSWVGDSCELATSSKLTIGYGSSIQHRSILIGDVEIGCGCVCGANLYISSYSHRFEDFPSWPIRWQDEHAVKNRSMAELSRLIRIGDDCWLGINVVIMPGVQVGRGAVIGANSVVTRDVPPYTVVAGVPAKVIKERLIFSPPSEISASNENDIPYFYHGFQMWRNDSSSFDENKNLEGWFAYPEFELMLKLEGARTLRVCMTTTHEIVVDAGASAVIMNPTDKYIDIPFDAISSGAIKVKWRAKNFLTKDVQVLVTAAKLM